MIQTPPTLTATGTDHWSQAHLDRLALLQGQLARLHERLAKLYDFIAKNETEKGWLHSDFEEQRSLLDGSPDPLGAGPINRRLFDIQLERAALVHSSGRAGLEAVDLRAAIADITSEIADLTSPLS